MKTCPFKTGEKCTNECALYIGFGELNEMVANRLKAIGVFTDSEGVCSLKNIALAQSRYIFENTVVYNR
jgi:hypothetical protein